MILFQNWCISIEFGRRHRCRGSHTSVAQLINFNGFGSTNFCCFVFFFGRLLFLLLSSFAWLLLWLDNKTRTCVLLFAFEMFNVICSIVYIFIIVFGKTMCFRFVVDFSTIFPKNDTRYSYWFIWAVFAKFVHTHFSMDFQSTFTCDDTYVYAYKLYVAGEHFREAQTDR